MTNTLNIRIRGLPVQKSFITGPVPDQFKGPTRVHETIRMTPAMQLGVTDHIWEIGELVEAALNCEPPERIKPRPHLPQGRIVGRFRVIDGGLA